MSIPGIDLTTLTAEQLKELQDKIKETKKELQQKERANKAPIKNAHYKCPGCTCGGLMGKAGLTLYCAVNETNKTKAPKMEEVNTWEVGRKPKAKVEQPVEEQVEEAA